MEKSKKYLQQFWKSQRENYFLNLQVGNQTFNKHPDIQVHQRPKPRGTWKTGHIIEMIKRRHHEERTAGILMPKNHPSEINSTSLAI